MGSVSQKMSHKLTKKIALFFRSFIGFLARLCSLSRPNYLDLSLFSNLEGFDRAWAQGWTGIRNFSPTFTLWPSLRQPTLRLMAKIGTSQMAKSQQLDFLCDRKHKNWPIPQTHFFHILNITEIQKTSLFSVQASSFRLTLPLSRQRRLANNRKDAYRVMGRVR